MSRLLINDQVFLQENSGVVTIDSNVNWPAGTILNASFHELTTRIALSFGASGTLWSFDVTKLYASDYSDLIMYLLLNGHQPNSDVCGFYAHIPGSTTTGTDGTAYYDIVYTANANANDPQMGHCRGKVFESLGVGTHTLTIGWNARNGTASQGPWHITNVNSSDDARQHAQSSTAVFYEIKK